MQFKFVRPKNEMEIIPWITNLWWPSQAGRPSNGRFCL